MKAEEGVLKHFALDRIQSLAITDESFTIEPTFNAIAYYTHFFGIWCDQSLTPQDIIISTTIISAPFPFTIARRNYLQSPTPMETPNAVLCCTCA